MPLDKQCHIFSIGTDSFYQGMESEIHKEMNLLRLETYDKDCTDERKKEIRKKLNILKEELQSELNKVVDSNIVRELNPEDVKPKNAISLFDSRLTRVCGIESGETSDKLFQVEFFFYQVKTNLIHNGFNYDGKHYVYFSSSAGSIRKHRGLFIEENLFQRIFPSLTAGWNIDTSTMKIKEINDKGGCVVNKWLAYLALSSSATTPWDDFDIDRAIVCDDYEIEVHGMMDYIDASDYSVTRKYTSVGIPMNDGVGMMLEEKTRVVRGPFIKGLLVKFDFRRFLLERCSPEQFVVKDIYGKEHNIITENIKYIFTKSQFKMWKYYDSWEQYKEGFKKHNCEISWCNMEVDDVSPSRINYQMLNSLHDMTDKEIERLTKKTVDEISDIGGSFGTNMKLLGAIESNENQNSFQYCLMKYPELIWDKWSQDVLKDVKKSCVKQARGGRIRINGYYRLASPDLYAYCERLFLGIENPVGLLKNGEVSISQFKDGEELDCLRSPHLYFEHCLRNNNRSKEVRKWFDTKCIYTSCNDLISRVLALDWDGDILLVTNNKTIKNVVKRNQSKYVPLLFDMRKANPVEINTKNIDAGLEAAFKYGKIGIYSNSCAKIWARDEIDEDSLTALKLLVAESNWSIDAAKCLYMPARPESANELIKKKTKGKLPNYFIYAKDKENSQVEIINDCVVNRIAKAIPNTRLNLVKSVGKFDYTVLINGQFETIRDENCDIIKRYTYWNNNQSYIASRMNADEKLEDSAICEFVRNSIIDDTSESSEVIANTIVWYLYLQHPTWSKKLLWNCFGNEIKMAVDANAKNLGRICPICGKRFRESIHNQICCSIDCAGELNKQKQRTRDYLEAIS